jgi:hypothetical protein
MDLLPNALRTLWLTGEAKRLDTGQLLAEQHRLIGEYAAAWTEALLLPAETSLADSLLHEILQCLPGMHAAEIVRRWSAEEDGVREEWRRRGVDPRDRAAVESFCD